MSSPNQTNFVAVTYEPGHSNAAPDTPGRWLSTAATRQGHQETRALTRYNKEFDRRLKALVGYEALRQVHKSTENSLLLADLVKEAA